MAPTEKGGSSWGRYRVLDRIAAGGMGAVHLARAHGELGFSRAVALKVLHAHLLEDQPLVDRFLAEAKVASRIAHPNVVAVLDVGRHENNVFLALEYVHGESLNALLRAARAAQEPVPLEVVSRIAIDFLEGLHAAHELVDEEGAPLGLVHRDISPHNILVGARGVAYVTDFGVAKIRDGIRHTQSGAVIGKAGYMAPEQLRGLAVSRVTDLYGAGIVLWELLTLRKLFQGMEEQIQRTLERFLPEPPGMSREDVPVGLDALVLRMLQPDPAARPATAQDVARELAELVKPAHASKVAEWVLGHAQATLDRREAILRNAETQVAEPAAAGPSVDVTHFTAGTYQEATDTTPDAPRRRTWLWATGALACLGVAAALGAHELSPAAPAIVLAPSAPSAPSAAPPRELPSVEPSPPPVASVISPRASARSPQAAPKAQAVDCSVPYTIEHNIKRWRRECFPGGKHAP